MQKELLSAYIDGEQVNRELTEKLCQDVELQKSWANFHAIRSVMRNESEILLGSDFTEKMEALIEKETILVSQPEPIEVEKLPFMQKLKAFIAPTWQIAVAASVCLVSVFSVQTLTTANKAKDVVDVPVLQTMPFNNSVQEVSYNAPVRDVATPEQIEQKNKRIGMMLQNYELQRRVYADNIGLQTNNK